MCNVECFFFYTFFASLLASSFPCTTLCTLILCMHSGDDFFLLCLINSRSSLLGWLFCDVKCLSCVLMRYIELTIFVNMYVGSMSLNVNFIVSCLVVSSALRMIWRLGNFCTILIFLVINAVSYDVT